jgi:hypothetical protein
MSAGSNDILDALFPACALAAFLEEAHARQGWPESDPTRRRAYALYEQALARKHVPITPRADQPKVKA